MPCACQNNVVPAEQASAFEILQANVNCSITLDNLNLWKNQLQCIKATEALPEGIQMVRINSYLGVVLSALNYPLDLCLYKSILDEMQPILAALPTTC